MPFNPMMCIMTAVSSRTLTLTILPYDGYRIFAFVDNEPDNLEAVADIDPDGNILLLHADTIFKSKRERVPKGAVSGSHYDVRPLFRKNFISGQQLYM